MKNKELQLGNEFVSDIKGIIEAVKTNAIRSVDFQRVVMYWRMGERIVVEEQQGKARAEYGSYLLQNLAKQLEPEYGSGFFGASIGTCTSILSHFSNYVRTADAIQLVSV